MILNDQQMEQILKLLLLKTREHKLDWYQEQGCVWHALPNQTTVELTLGDRPLDFTMQVKGASGELLGQIQGSAEGVGSKALGELYDAALQSAGKSLFVEIIDSLKVTEPATTTTTAPPQTTTTTAPPQVTCDQVATVLKKMAGKWDLEYTRGKERVIIDESGAYTILGRSEPTFYLKVLAWNEATNTAEVAKDRPDGSRLHIEYLKITTDAMIGHAKHDMHKLSYRRMV
ncbi:MAG TPA: hypothetical protein VMF69_26745 [Gemmataceae bacterium]|nr:hypothetical protein [Gemmataceae bacterium]